MVHLTFSVLLLAAVLEPGPYPDRPSEFSRWVSAEPCEVARRIAEHAPCLRPEDCGALQEWKRIFGPPGVEPLTPEVARGKATRSLLSPSPGGVTRRPVVFPCPATTDRGRRPG